MHQEELAGGIHVGLHDAKLVKQFERMGPAFLRPLADRLPARIVGREKLGKEVELEIFVGEIRFRRSLQECLLGFVWVLSAYLMLFSVTLTKESTRSFLLVAVSTFVMIDRL